jgi:hypothetical protein
MDAHWHAHHIDDKPSQSGLVLPASFLMANEKYLTVSFPEKMMMQIKGDSTGQTECFMPRQAGFDELHRAWQSTENSIDDFEILDDVGKTHKRTLIFDRS